jgi:hypothetical protein
MLLIETVVFRADTVGTLEVEQGRIQSQPTPEVKERKSGFVHGK